MIGLAVNQGETVCDRIQPRALGRGVPVLGYVSGVHDLGEPDQRGIPGEAELVDKYVEGAHAVPVGVLRAGSIVGVRAFSLCRCQDLIPWDIEELCVRVDEPPDQPWAGDPVDVGVLAGDPLHDTFSLISGAELPAALALPPSFTAAAPR